MAWLAAVLPVSAAAVRAAWQQPRQPVAALRVAAAVAQAVPRVLPAASAARSRQAPAVAAAGSSAVAVPEDAAAGSSAAVAGSPAAVALEAALAARRIAAADRLAACGWRCREVVQHQADGRVDARRQPEAVDVVAAQPRSELLHRERQLLAPEAPRAASGSQFPEAVPHAAAGPADGLLRAAADRLATASRCLEQAERQGWARRRLAPPRHCWAVRLPGDGRRRPGDVDRPAPGPSPADGCRQETAMRLPGTE